MRHYVWIGTEWFFVGSGLAHWAGLAHTYWKDRS
jgi:hypothetical protein